MNPTARPAADPTVALAWAKDGAEHLRGLVACLGDEAFAAPSALPGWTRGHLLSHVARNADALVNLLTWARTGTPTPAYRDEAARDAGITDGARRSPDEIRADVIASSDRLADAVRALPPEAWSATVEIRGRSLPAAEVPWLRAVETWVHAVDLDVGAGFTDLPQPMLVALLSDVAGTFGDRPGGAAAVLVATGSPAGRWQWGDPAPGSPEISGSAAELAAWLTGRSRGKHLRRPIGAALPSLGSWR